MYTVNGHQIRNAITSEKNQADVKKSPLGRIKITGSDGKLILGPAAGTSGMDSFTITETINELFNPTCGMSDEDKQKYHANIMRKLKQGKKLTGEEMAYLRMTDPTLYLQAARIQAMRESLEKQLENCKSKQETQQAFDSAISNVGDKDPMKEEVIAALSETMKEYKDSDKYKALPEKEKPADKKGQHL